MGKVTPPDVVLVNGPNLNMLGRRDESIYGSRSLEDVVMAFEAHAAGIGLKVDSYQSNSEGEIISRIHSACGVARGIVINAGAYTHTSIAIRDALECFVGAIVEVHISNIYRRESFRHVSLISPIADGVICGCGTYGYILALDYLATVFRLR